MTYATYVSYAYICTYIHICIRVSRKNFVFLFFHFSKLFNVLIFCIKKKSFEVAYLRHFMLYKIFLFLI